MSKIKGYYSSYCALKENNARLITNELNNGKTYKNILESNLGSYLIYLDNKNTLLRMCHPIYEYSINGKTYYGYDSIGYSKSLIINNVGKEVEIEVNDQYPNISKMSKPGFAIGLISFILSIISITALFIPIISLPLSIATLIISCISISKNKDTNIFGIASLIISIIGIILSILSLLLYIFVLKLM